MTTPARIQANRENSKRSTGPRTGEGKAVSSLNRRSHGFSAADPVLPTEDRSQYNQLVKDYTRDWTPQTTHERFLVEQLASASWKLKRLERIQDEMFAELDSPRQAFTDPQKSTAFERLERYRASLERTYHRAIRELRIARKEQNEAKSVQEAEKKYDDLTEQLVRRTLFPRLPTARELGLWPPPNQAGKTPAPNPQPSDQK